MDLYKLENNKLQEVSRKNFDLEKDIQSLIETNTEDIFNLEFVSSEFTMGQFRLDSLCFDNETKSFVIIEYKKGSSYSVIDQGYSYLSIMLENKSDFILEYNENKDRNLKREDIDWSQSRILFISQSFNSYQKNSVNFKDVPFELWEIKRFSDDLVSLNRHLPSSKESIQKFDSGKNSVIKNVSKEVKVYDEETTIKNTSEKLQSVYLGLKEKISNWDDIKFVPKRKYIGVWKNNKVFVYLNFRKKHIRTHLLINMKYTKGDYVPKSSTVKPFVLDDPKNMFSIWENDYKKLYSHDLIDSKDLDYFVLMIKQKYDSLN